MASWLGAHARRRLLQAAPTRAQCAPKRAAVMVPLWQGAWTLCPTPCSSRAGARAVPSRRRRRRDPRAAHAALRHVATSPAGGAQSLGEGEQPVLPQRTAQACLSVKTCDCGCNGARRWRCRAASVTRRTWTTAPPRCARQWRRCAGAGAPSVRHHQQQQLRDAAWARAQIAGRAGIARCMNHSSLAHRPQPR
eukprot:scaffold1175_cov330-Prasinococcus_capsulatus_cf.AAC.11